MIEDSIQAALQAFVLWQLNDVYTAMPCRIESVENSKELRVNVKPLTNRVYEDGSSIERPTILSVPVMQYATNTSMVSLPVHKGDTGLCIFAMRSIDKFKAGDGDVYSPAYTHFFDKKDAIFLPGLFPFSKHPIADRVTSTNVEDLVVTHNIGTASENSITLKETGEISLVSPVKVQIETPTMEFTGAISVVGNTSFVGNVEITGTTTINGLEFEAHTHTGVTTGVGVSGPVSI